MSQRQRQQMNRLCKGRKCMWLGAVLLASLVWILVFSHRPAPVPIQRPVTTPQDNEVAESTPQAGAEFSLERGEVDGQTVPAETEATPQIQQLEEGVPVEQLTISRLPPRPDAHCSKDVDASLPDLFEAERQAAVFACRKAKARKQAEAACDGINEAAAAKPFVRGSLDIAALTKPESGGGAAFGVRVNAETKDIPDSVPIALEPDSDIVSGHILANGHWEYNEIRTILTALQLVDKETAGAAPPLLLDVGANLGTYTITAAALGYEVIAFEAMERNVAAIHQTLCWTPELREKITLFPYALGAEDLSCVVVSDTINVADGHVVCNEEEIAAMAGALSRATVHSVRLGDYLAGVKADVMKIDVEGYEPHVLSGAGTALDSVQFALTEVSAQDMPKATGKSFDDCGPEYLGGWLDRGFNITHCDVDHNCFALDVVSTEDALQASIKEGLANFLMRRHDD